MVTLAAIGGDSTGYWFGKKVGIKLFLKPDSKWFHREHLSRAEHFYEKYGARTILFARFLPIIRTFAPIVAGIANMRYRTFLTYNIIGALVWATGITWLGYFLGVRLPFISDYLTFIILGIIFVTSIPIFLEAYRAQKNQ